MARIAPLRRDEAPECDDLFARAEDENGYLPRSMLTIARRPEVLRALDQLGQAVASGTVPAELKQLVALVASTAAGCRYCQAHTASTAARTGGRSDRVTQVWSYETSPLFDNRERVALRVAHHAGLVPNQVTDEDFEQLRRYFDDGQIVELVAVISLFGFLNRWNDTMATELEDEPTALAHELLGTTGWTPGKHDAIQQPANGSRA